jgi:hypothetical protein
LAENFYHHFQKKIQQALSARADISSLIKAHPAGKQGRNLNIEISNSDTVISGSKSKPVKMSVCNWLGLPKGTR